MYNYNYFPLKQFYYCCDNKDVELYICNRFSFFINMITYYYYLLPFSFHRLLQMTVLTVLFFRSRVKDFVKSSFLFENAFFARAILDLMSCFQDSWNVVLNKNQRCSFFITFTRRWQALDRDVSFKYTTCSWLCSKIFVANRKQSVTVLQIFENSCASNVSFLTKSRKQYYEEQDFKMWITGKQVPKKAVSREDGENGL